MLTAEEQMELVILKKHGDGIRLLNRLTGRSRNTVRRYLRGGDAAATRQPAPKRPEKLDPTSVRLTREQIQLVTDCLIFGCGLILRQSL